MNRFWRLTIKPKEPLLFLNIESIPGGTALIWDHTEDSPGKRCPNPRNRAQGDSAQRGGSARDG